MKIRFAFPIGSLAGTILAMAMLAPPAGAGASPPVTLDQGANWTATAQKDFYSRD
jgi:hypothetical protein